MIRDQVTADDRIADALWFLKGFAAASSNDSAVIAADLSDKLNQVRKWITAISSGELRLIGTDERNFYIVLAEQEYEKLVDGVRSIDAADKAIGMDVHQSIHPQIDAERRAFAKRCEVPF
ncbi:MAG: hypothetical protein IPG83_02220 [Novosphingobium sp.]|nr:hypothetical protein [Novosphingobium sp.]